MTIEQEKTAAMRYIRAALKRGYLITVWEGEDYAIVLSDSAPAIREALASTDIDIVEIWKPSQRFGNLLFVWGNSPEEVLSDFSACPEIKEIVEDAEDG